MSSRPSRLVEAVESGAEPEIIIARNERPAWLVPIAPVQDTSKRIGLTAGKWPDMSLEDFDADNVWGIAIKRVRGHASAPPVSGRADPFDRLFVAQALVEPLRLLAHDRNVTADSDTFVLF